MALAPGVRLGPYEVSALIGEGGMGKVWRAHHTALKRDDALKVLPDAFASDRDRLARFQREARVLASLNHPNIAHVYGLEQADGVQALVMELVEGPTLADRIAQGPIPVDEALPIARQIAEALEAAHERGIIHRDLKPANIKVRPDGTVKVLDFGLAKALDSGPTAIDASHSPTITSPAMMTSVGILLGTAAYMSPEQARGKPVDKRTDIWAFGCVLYEMLTGKRPFDGEEITDVIGRVLERDPDFEILPARTPPAVRRLLRRSLQKDRRARLRDAGDAIAELDEARTESPGAVATASAPRTRHALVASVATGLLLVGAALGWVIGRNNGASTERALRLGVALPPGAEVAIGEKSLVLSPDGTTLVVRLSIGGSPPQFYSRLLEQFDWAPIAGTERAGAASFSRDGQWLHFNADNKLWKVPAKGGTRLLMANTAFPGAVAGPDDSILYTPSYSQGLWRMPASGGTPEKLTEPDAAAGELGHWWPQLLPDGETVLFTAYVVPIERSRISLYSLRTRERRVLLEGGVSATYVGTGHILYARAEALMAVPFDAGRLELRGQPVPVLDDVRLEPGVGSAYFATSEAGDLAYIRGSDFRHERIVLVDSIGEVQPAAPAGREYGGARVSPDGRRLAITIRDSASRDVWTYDLERGSFTRVTSDPTDEFSVIWTPDGKRLIFSVEEPVFHTYWKAIDTAEKAELLLGGPFDSNPLSVSPDGRFLIFRQGHPETGADLWLMPLQGKREPRVLVRSPFDETNGVVSPDGRWLAYQSDDSGRPEIYVQGFPEPGERSAVSTQGGIEPAWSRDGRELFYRDENRLMAVSVRTTPRFSAGKPAVVFERPGRTWNFDVNAGERNFVLVERDPSTPPAAVNVVLNWHEELKRLVPTN